MDLEKILRSKGRKHMIRFRKSNKGITARLPFGVDSLVFDTWEEVGGYLDEISGDDENKRSLQGPEGKPETNKPRA